MTVLLSLPVELLRQILAELDAASLGKSSRVCRLFNTLSEPLLYTSLGDSSLSPGWLLPLLSALLARPSLARHVRSITFLHWAECYPTPANCVLFSAKAAALGIPDLGWWDDAQALFLLHLVPHVQDLRFSDTPLLRTSLEQTVATPIADVPFQSLVRFTSDSPATLTLLLALMRLPAMRSIDVAMPYDDDDDDVHRSRDPAVLQRITAFVGQSSVTHLALHSGCTTNALLQLILAMPRQLTSLSYMYEREYGMVDDTPPMHAVLAPLRPALRALSFGGVYASGVGAPREVRLGSLRDWPALTTLNCSLAALLGSREHPTGRLVDVLPLRIRRLFVWRKDEDCVLVKSREQWGVWQMTDQLVELLLCREMDCLTVNTCASVYVEKKGAGREGWVNQYEAGVVRRLEAAVGTRRCRIVCF